MTIILCALPDNCPVLFGDLMISGFEKENHALKIPGLGLSTDVFPVGSGYVVNGMRQKLYVINKDLAIAWSGSMLGARIIVLKLIKLSKKNNFDAKILSDYLHNLEDDIKSLGVSIIAFYVVQRIESQTDLVEVCISTYNVEAKKTDIGPVFLSGSGDKVITDIISELNKARIATDDNIIYPVNRAKALVNFLASYLLLNEKNIYDSTINYFGGMYESILYLDNRLSKISNSAFVYCNCFLHENDDLSISLPHKVIYQFYENEDLYIRYFETDTINDSNDLTINIKEHSFFKIMPLVYQHKRSDVNKALKKRIQQKYVYSYVNIYRYIEKKFEAASTEYLYTMVLEDSLSDTRKSLYINLELERNNSLTFSISKGFFDHISTSFKKINFKDLQDTNLNMFF